MSEQTVLMTDESGRQVRLDINNGYVYDMGGNQVAKWAPSTNNYTEATALYCSEQAALATASAIGGPEGRAFMMSWRNRIGDAPVKMDLDPNSVYVPSATQYVQGYRNGAPVADIASAPLLQGKASGMYWEFAKEDAFQQVIPSMVPGQVGEIAPRVANKPFATSPRALGGFVSVELQAAADAQLRIRQSTAKRIMGALLINREIEVATLLNTAANWDASVVTTIAGAAKWNGGASSDPIKDLLDAKRKVWGTANAIVMPEPVYDAFIQNAKVQSLITNKSNAAPLPMEAAASQLFGLPPIYIARMQKLDASGNKQFIWGNDVVLLTLPESMPPMSQDDISTCTTFRWDVSGVTDGSASGGWIVREFVDQKRGHLGGSTMVICHYDDVKLTSKFAGALLKDCVQ